MPSHESQDTLDPRFRGDSEKRSGDSEKNVATPAKAGVHRSSEISHSLSSVESLRSSLPESYRSLFDTLRRAVIDFCSLHHIPTSSLNNDKALREATKHLSIPELEQLSLVLARLDYLVRNKEPMREAELTDSLEYAEKHYHLREQYTSQVSLLEQVGILRDGCIRAIDGKRYPVPTLEQIDLRLFERRQELSSKHDQGFTKLLLVPFGMSLDVFFEILRIFLFDYKEKHPDFNMTVGDNLLWAWGCYQEADTETNPDNSPVLVYHPTSFDRVNHQGKTKAQILEEQATNPDSFPGWTIHLFQPSNPKDPSSLGIAPIPRESQGKTYGQDTEDSLDPTTPSRPDIEAQHTPKDYLSLLTGSKHNLDSPYLHETGLTPEDWIMAFILHLQETGKPLDDVYNSTNQESFCLFIGAFFPSSTHVPKTYWDSDYGRIDFSGQNSGDRSQFSGTRSSVMI